jgi:fucose 4-O-acetylase-like acetyltransferase
MAAANAARVSIVSGVLFVLLLGSLHLLEPEFNPSWRFLSEYELGKFGWLMRLAFLALATSLASAGLAIFSQARTAVGYIGIAGLGIAAVGMVIAAIFRTDPATTSREALTFSGKMHVFGASLDYTPVAALFVSLSLARNTAWRPIRKWLYITVCITWVALAAFMATLPYNGKIGPGALAGLFGRILLVSYLGWLVTVGIHTIRLLKHEAAC